MFVLARQPSTVWGLCWCNMFYFPLLFRKGIDFSTGYMFLFFSRRLKQMEVRKLTFGPGCEKGPLVFSGVRAKVADMQIAGCRVLEAENCQHSQVLVLVRKHISASLE